MKKNKYLHLTSLSSISKKEEVYNDWADTYDSYVGTLNYTAPLHLAENLNKINTIDNPKILDFGCGTGLLGENIKKIMKCDLFGIDISKKMIEKSIDKGFYNYIYNVNLKEKTIHEKFDYIVSSGVFLEGHVGFDMIPILLSLLKKKGIILFTVRDTFKQKNKLDYEKYVSNNKNIYILSEKNIEYLENVNSTLIIISNYP